MRTTHFYMSWIFTFTLSLSFMGTICNASDASNFPSFPWLSGWSKVLTCNVTYSIFSRDAVWPAELLQHFVSMLWNDVCFYIAQSLCSDTALYLKYLNCHFCYKFHFLESNFIDDIRSNGFGTTLHSWFNLTIIPVFLALNNCYQASFLQLEFIDVKERIPSHIRQSV